MRELIVIEISVNDLFGDNILFEGCLVEEYLCDMWQVYGVLRDGQVSYNKKNEDDMCYLEKGASGNRIVV